MGSHNHNHSHNILDQSREQRVSFAYTAGIILNLGFTIIEYVVGFWSGSLALISDASHNLSDVISLIISLIGTKLTKKKKNASFTYGYKKASILASLINAILIISVGINILIEAVKSLNNPTATSGKVIMITASIGVIINVLSAFLFYRDQKSDINLRGAFLHLAFDALVSLGVIISGVLIYLFDWQILDSIVGIIIAIIIIVSSWGLLQESLKLILDGVPSSIHVDELEKILEQTPKVLSVHHLHVWALSTTENALTAHIKVDSEVKNEEMKQLKHALKDEMRHYNIQHCTFEMEAEENPCENPDCD